MKNTFAFVYNFKQTCFKPAATFCL